MTDTAKLRDFLPHLYRISRIFSLAVELDEVLSRMLDEVIAATAAERGFLFLSDAGGRPAIRAARHKDLRTIESPPDDNAHVVAAQVSREGRPLLTTDAPHEPERQPRTSASQPDRRSILCAPLQAKDVTLGVIYVDTPLQTGAFTPDDLELLVVLAQQSAIAIDNARLFRDVRAQVQSLHLLHDITTDLTSTLDLQRVLTTSLERVQQTLGTQAGSILTLEGDELVFQVAIGEKADQVKPFRIPKSHGIAGWVALNGRGTYSNDVHNDPRFYGTIDKRSGFVTQMIMAAPLVVNRRVIGVIEVFNKPGGFDAGDLDLLSTIAAGAGIAIENARLYQVAIEKGRLEQEISLARDVQANLIPRTTPRIPGWEFAAHWQSALVVSGDFYDFIPGAGDSLGIVIGDVADKGMPAAMFMTLTRTIVRASVGYGRSPADSIAYANRLICADAADGMFVTLCYARLDPESGELCYVNAGHPAPLLYRAASGAVIELPGHGTALGIADTLPYGQQSMQLGPGDLLVFYTDGVPDALNAAGEDFGKERLMRVVEAHGREPVEAVYPALRQALDDFTRGTSPADDATFVVVRRNQTRG